MRIAYLFTTFPKASESFLQREIDGLGDHTTADLSLFSLSGGRGATFNRFPLKHFNLEDVLRLPLRLLIELIRNPKAFLVLAELYNDSPPKCPINLIENLLGIAFAISYAERFRQKPPEHIHATWATAPAAAALTLSMLTGIPYSMEAHAYDIHRKGGDCLLLEKGRRACFVRTSTEDARSSLVQKGLLDGSIFLIRRCLPDIPPTLPLRHPRSVIHLLSVGRLIEKKGYFDQLHLYRRLKDLQIPFYAKIIGDGSLASQLAQSINNLGLKDEVEMCGSKDYAEVERHYQQWADYFIFTGKVSSSGDRDGFPNVLAEAMAAGIPVLTRDVAGISEAIRNKETGIVLKGTSVSYWANQFKELLEHPQLQESIRHHAHEWIRENFSAPRNNSRLLKLIQDKCPR